MLSLTTQKGIMCNEIIRNDVTTGKTRKTGKAGTTKMTVAVAPFSRFFVLFGALCLLTQIFPIEMHLLSTRRLLILKSPITVPWLYKAET
jgi:hypothetical protein